MRRVRYDSPGDPLLLEEAPVPEPAPGELLVRCEAVGVTLPVVRKVTEAAEPVPLGGEVAGEVVAAGAGVTRFRTGDRVTGLCFGHGYADFALLHEAMASPIPDDASAVDAVALVRGGLVALGALDAARPEPGEAALVTAAASGVGHPAVQLARRRGAARVVGAVSTPAKADFVRSLGADAVVGYGDDGWGEPVDYALDAVGGELLTPALAALAPGGGSWRRELWRLFTGGEPRPAVHGKFALEDAAKAHEAIESRSDLGKVVLLP
ncbi:zinc-binding dehydrogenase [Streptomyces spinoverrucosus]|uniref:quinone oxidoreductase family protein n=1 Tax=Streptomyces spinoverrucosus TaxID=284043 RepID=UPI0018C3E758|nr:zinc-binding dehydrogenase [Streptomyces spinoverrucosus]MBG0851182.1 zinc-binding dehydrogenase [Streptomyces spinoverrucosus]